MFLPGNSAVSTLFQTPLSTPGARMFGGMEVPEVKRLKSLEEENADSKSYLPKPCWIRRRFRWLLGESTDDRPETGSRGDDV